MNENKELENTEPERLEPVSNAEKVEQNGKLVKMTVYNCPRCGNQINKYNSKYNCRFCKQYLKWPERSDKKGGDRREY